MPVLIGVRTPAPRRGRRFRVERQASIALLQFAAVVDRPAQGGDHAPLPLVVRPEGETLGAIRSRADRGIATRIERLQGDRNVFDPYDFADLQAIADIEPHAFAQPHEPRAPRDAIVRGRDLRHRAADAGFGERGVALRPTEKRAARARWPICRLPRSPPALREPRSCGAPERLDGVRDRIFRLADFIGYAVEGARGLPVEIRVPERREMNPDPGET